MTRAPTDVTMMKQERLLQRFAYWTPRGTNRWRPPAPSAGADLGKVHTKRCPRVFASSRKKKAAISFPPGSCVANDACMGLTGSLRKFDTNRILGLRMIHFQKHCFVLRDPRTIESKSSNKCSNGTHVKFVLCCVPQHLLIVNVGARLVHNSCLEVVHVSMICLSVHLGHAWGFWLCPSWGMRCTEGGKGENTVICALSPQKGGFAYI